MSSVRLAAVAGDFYPSQAAVLARDVQRMLDDAPAPALPGVPKAIMAPHAGYAYSGSTAAQAFVLLKPLRDVIKRVVLLGPVHRVAVRGLALPGVQAFETPLGRVDLDQAAVAELVSYPQVVTSPAAHAWEHAIEVQLPFLQTVLADFQLVPLAVGDATSAEVSEVLEALWGGPETLIVISSDLSHFLTDEAARARDRETIQRVLQGQAQIDASQACGATAINGLMPLARKHGLKPHLLSMCNSADACGDTARVVGYASLAYVPEAESIYARSR